MQALHFKHTLRAGMAPRSVVNNVTSTGLLWLDKKPPQSKQVPVGGLRTGDCNGSFVMSHKHSDKSVGVAGLDIWALQRAAKASLISFPDRGRPTA